MIPTKNDVQAVDPVLTGILVGYMQADSRFVASRAFPAVPVEKDSGTYYILTKKYSFLDQVKRRAPGGVFERAGYGVETATYAVQLWGLEHPVPDENKANSQLPLDLERIGLSWLAQQSLIRKERAWAADFMAASVWDNTDNNSVTDWDDFTAGDPANDIQTGLRTVSGNTGYLPNMLIVGEIVNQALMLHPDMIDRIKHVQAATAATMQGAIPGILGVEQYLVAMGFYNSANEAQSASYSAIIDDDALLIYSNPGAGVMGATAGKTFSWAGGGGTGSIVTYRDQSVKSDILQLSEAWDQKVVAADLGYIWLDVV